MNSKNELDSFKLTQVQSTRAGPLRVEGQPDKKEIGGTTMFWQCWGLGFGFDHFDLPSDQGSATGL